MVIIRFQTAGTRSKCFGSVSKEPLLTASENGPSVDYFNPFIEAVVATMQSMCSATATRTDARRATGGLATFGITAVCNLTGEHAGMAILDLPEDTALGMASRLVGEGFERISGRAVAGVGELAGNIFADAKNRLSGKGFNFEVGEPRMLVGRNHIAKQDGGFLVIAFDSDLGPFALELSMGS